MKTFLDLFLLFIAWPDEAKEFEEHCREVYKQKERQTSSWINWKFDPTEEPNQDFPRERYTPSFDFSSEEFISLPTDDLLHDSDYSEYDNGTDDEGDGGEFVHESD